MQIYEYSIKLFTFRPLKIGQNYHNVITKQEQRIFSYRDHHRSSTPNTVSTSADSHRHRSSVP